MLIWRGHAPQSHLAPPSSVAASPRFASAMRVILTLLVAAGLGVLLVALLPRVLGALARDPRPTREDR